jgi:two-component system, OmpR family, alkaline phosphatase synthesis response regulator PhoP
VSATGPGIAAPQATTPAGDDGSIPAAPARVLVVDDDPIVRDVLTRYLEREGFDVAEAEDGEAAISAARTARPHVVLLDLMLPKVDGLEVFRTIQEPDGPAVIMLTAKGEEVDRVVGLELGADDYVTKPFSPRELVARIKAILRRSTATPHDRRDPVVVGDVEVDLARHEARRNGNPVTLAPREFALLAVLVENRGLVLSRRQLLDLAWGYDWYGDERTVDVHVRQLRRKLGDGLPLVTLRRTGYRLG